MPSQPFPGWSTRPDPPGHSCERFDKVFSESLRPPLSTSPCLGRRVAEHASLSAFQLHVPERNKNINPSRKSNAKKLILNLRPIAYLKNQLKSWKVGKQSTKGPICVSYTVFHDPVGRSSQRIHNQKKRDDGISSGRGGSKGLAQCQGTQSSTQGRRKNREVFQEPVCDGGE